MIKMRQFTGNPFDGILYQTAQRVSAPERGIVFNRPERYIVNTPFGQMEICKGDWLIEVITGNRYVIKDADIMYFSKIKPSKKWWRFW